MLKKSKEKEASLISPNDLGRFVTHTSEYEEALPILHAKFKVNRIEKYRPHMIFPLPPHRKPVYDFLFLTQGTSTRGKGMDTYDISSNTFFFLPAYQILNNESMSEDVQGFYCHFDLEIFSKKLIQKDFLAEFPFLQYIGNPIVKIPQQATPSVLSILKRLEYEYEHGAKCGFDLIGSYLLTLFLELKCYVPIETKIGTDAAAHTTQRYKDALAHHIYDYQKVSEFAQLLSISPNHLNRCVQATTGRSAQDLLSEMVLLEVKVLLKQTPLSISEIVYKIGKKDPSDFSRFFKNQTGMTPKEYRNS
ncbi:MAG: AraC family transcriptional regulator [Saprospiraceae bacterium]|nr:AraC family transcriptional regulator [Saprospiraceae bacterium]